LDSIGRLDGNLAESIPKAILGRLDVLYPKIAPPPPETTESVLRDFGAPTLEMPEKEILGTRFLECSFKGFDDPDAYAKCERAKSYVSWSAPRNEYYRIYFNDYSKKVYVDLNATRWCEARSAIEEEALYCEILRTLIFVLTCEVERVSGAGLADTVTESVTEIIIS